MKKSDAKAFGDMINAVARLTVYVSHKIFALKHRFGIDPKPCYVKILSLVSVSVAHDVPIFICDENTAALTDVAVSCHAFDLLRNIILKTVRIVANLNKATVLQYDTRIFSGKRCVSFKRLASEASTISCLTSAIFSFKRRTASRFYSG